MTPSAERILVRGVNWLGDAVMSTPALQRLREARPDAHITLLTHEKLADLWWGHPSIDIVQTFAAGESVWRVGRRLRQENFSIGLALPNSPRSALELWLARIPQRIGYAQPWRNAFLTQAIPPRPGTVPMRKRSRAEIQRLINGNSAPPQNIIPSSAHHLHEYLHLVAALGAKPEPVAPSLHVGDEELEAVRVRFGLLDETTRHQPWFGLNAGAEYGPAKRWPAERFIAAATELQRRTECRWLIFGGKSDVELATRLAVEITSQTSPLAGPVNLAGQTSLRELCAALKLCRVLLTNDTGPMHVAVALGTPVVVPFGSTSPELTGPGLPGDLRHQLLKSCVPCSPCFLRECPIDFRCMTGISVDRVVNAVLAAIGDLR